MNFVKAIYRVPAARSLVMITDDAPCISDSFQNSKRSSADRIWIEHILLGIGHKKTMPKDTWISLEISETDFLEMIGKKEDICLDSEVTNPYLFTVGLDFLAICKTSVDSQGIYGKELQSVPDDDLIEVFI